MNEEEIKAKLTLEEYKVLREKATEAPGTGKYLNEKREGMYKCKVCGQTLFDSGTKFDSGTGWPSFEDAIPGAVEYVADDSHGMERTEVVCSHCKSHLGHVFEYGQGYKTKKHYCINSVCLDLYPEDSQGD